MDSITLKLATFASMAAAALGSVLSMGTRAMSLRRDGGEIGARLARDRWEIDGRWARVEARSRVELRAERVEQNRVARLRAKLSPARPIPSHCNPIHSAALDCLRRHDRLVASCARCDLTTSASQPCCALPTTDPKGSTIRSPAGHAIQEPVHGSILTTTCVSHIPLVCTSVATRSAEAGNET